MRFQKGHKGYKYWLGKKRPDISKIMMGHLVSDETKKKISQSNLGKLGWWKGKRLSEISKKRMSLAKKGKIYWNKRKGKMIICLICQKEKYKYPRDLKRAKNQFCSKKCAYQFFKGKHHSLSSEYKTGQFAGKKHPKWKGGITPINNKLRGSEKGRNWIKSVFIKDNFICLKCGEKTKSNLTAHHIQNFGQFPELRFVIDNGITFCRKCHKLFHKIYDKKNNNLKQINEFLLLFNGKI